MSAPKQPPPQAVPALRIGTLNVHMWRNRDGQSTFDPLVQLLRDARLDVIALQEAPRTGVAALARELNLSWIAHRSTAILTRFRFKALEGNHAVGGSEGPAQASAPQRGKRDCRCNTTRYTRARVAIPLGANGVHCIDVVCVHLSHRREPERQSEMARLMAHLSGKCAPPLSPAAIFLGDFNALTAADYSRSAWERIASVRAANSWEYPTSKLMDALTDQARDIDGRRVQLNDAHACAESRSGPWETCRFNTRIDYVLLSAQVARTLRVLECAHVVAMPHISDHNLVVASLLPR